MSRKLSPTTISSSTIGVGEDGPCHTDDGSSNFPEDNAVTSSSEDELASVRLSETLEVQFRRKKPEGIDEVEETQILHLLRWIIKHDPVKRPSAEEILRHEWFRT